jgi:glutamyl-tRNA synthetase
MDSGNTWFIFINLGDIREYMRDKIFKYVLQNAVFYGGKANPKSVMGKVMSSEPDLREKSFQAVIEVEKMVQEVNSMSPERQKELLEKEAPELLERGERKQEGIPELPEAVEGKVVTRFAPAPTGPLNISHLLRAVMLSYLYAKKYKGRFIVRFEDTDASRIKKSYYGMIREDLEMAGVKWNRIGNVSDDMKAFYRNAELLVGKSKAYMCACPAEAFRKLKLIKTPCPCRDNSRKVNMVKWKLALSGKYREGGIVLRFKTSMKDPNPALRDPPIMRVSKTAHPLKGRKYPVWPLYNFANVVSDHEGGITHVFRGKEHEHNTEIQRRMYQALGWKPPATVNFGMIYLSDDKLHTRDVAGMIKSKKVSGWDDPRLHTIRSLIRRGFTPEAFAGYAEHCSLTKTDIRLDWKIFESYNRKALDPIADRCMVVTDPVKIDISKTDQVGRSISVRVHPEKPATRTIKVTKNVFVSREDYKRFRGKEIRLKELANGVLARRLKPTGEGSDVRDRKLQKIQWVPEPHVNVRIVKPEAELNGIGEQSMRKLRVGDLIQMERIGFGRVDKKAGDKVTIFFAHK